MSDSQEEAGEENDSLPRTVVEAPVEKRPRWMVLGLLALIPAVGLVSFLVGRSSDNPNVDRASESPTLQASSAQPSATSPRPDASGVGEPVVPGAAPLRDDWYDTPRSGPTGVDGLDRGTATVASGYRSTLYGTPYGWDQTIEGAVGAAFHVSGSHLSLGAVVEGTYEELSKQLYTGPQLDFMLHDEDAIAVREVARQLGSLNDEGVVVDAQGQPVPEQKYYGGSIPQYGAYRIGSVEGPSDKPTEVVLMLYQPMFVGHGNDQDMSEVRLFYTLRGYAMTWIDGDWKMSSPAKTDEYPESAFGGTVEYSNQGYAWLRERLGPGWVVPLDAREDAVPGAVKTR